MLGNANSLIGYSVLATDGEIGMIDDLFFDDKTWSTAYLVVRMGGLPNRREVLLPPTALGKPDWEKKEFPVAYSKRQVANSPGADFIKLITNRRGMVNGEDPMWPFSFAWSDASGSMLPDLSLETDDPYLRSVKELIGYRIQAMDGMIGHVEDLIVDDSTWAICYVVDVSNWMTGRKTLISTDRVKSIVWEEQRVHVSFTKKMMQSNAKFERSMQVNPGYEEQFMNARASINK